MRDRQLCAVTLAAASVPALLYLPRLGWVWATAAAAISALLLGLCGRRCAPGGLTEVIPAAFGREVQRGRCAPSIRRAAAGRLRDSCCFWRRPMPQSAGRRPSCAAGPSCSSSSRRSRPSYWAFRPCRCARRGSRRRRDACPLPP